MSNSNIYTLQHIILLESSFRRDWIIEVNNDEFKNVVDIEVLDTKNESHLNVQVNLRFEAGVEDKKHQIFAEIKMVGVFALPESSDLPIDKFAKINAPAIIFPFIREHLSSLSLKAGISPILLPPVNFTKKTESNEDSAGSRRL